METPTNGEPKKKTLAGVTNGFVPWRWVVGVLMSILVTVVGLYLRGVSDSIDDLQKQVETLNGTVSALNTSNGTLKDGQTNIWDAIKAANTTAEQNSNRLGVVEEWQREHDQQKINQLERQNKAGKLARNRDWKSVEKQFKSIEENAVYP